MPATKTRVATGLLPAAPSTLEQSGLSADLVTELLLKTLYFQGTLSGLELARCLGVPFSVIDEVLAALKWQHCVEVAGGTALGEPTFNYAITDAGRKRTALLLDHSHYVGVAPVPLEQYWRYMEVFHRKFRDRVTPERARYAFRHLVLSQKVLDGLGPGVQEGHSLFVYGPPGNGKTVIAQSIRNLLAGDIAIPRALVIDGSIVRVYDPVNHETLPEPEQPDSLDRASDPDGRWVRCRRPLITVGGELTLESLDLQYSKAAGVYRAPVQVLANGGVLVIDDFGRQKCSPQALLNRWITPLESRVDYLSLQSGLKFALPFAVLVVFATNIKPLELVDEAFLRRIKYKVFAGSPTVEDFIRIFENYCTQVRIEFDRAVVEHLLERYYRPRNISLRGCQPRDLISQSLALAEYLGQPRKLTPALLEAACERYFVDDGPTQDSRA